MGEYTWIDVSGPIAKGEKADLFDTDAGELWIPKSQTAARKRDEGHATVRLEVTAWWARKHGLLDEKDDA